jgi:hypothetical protein
VNIAIIAPVYNDWESAQQLCRELDRELSHANHRASLWFVDDGSTERSGIATFPRGKAITEVNVIELHGNQGHQRAIAIGLCYLAAKAEAYDGFLIMDCDGEDKPSAVPAILAAAAGKKVVVAQRAKRHERFSFQAGYFFYKFLFFLCTGRSISFGNFLYLPSKFTGNLAHSPSASSHLAATVIKLGLPSLSVQVDRGQRYAGKTHMNFLSLVLHGLSAISVFSEVALTRIILFTLIVTSLCFGGMATAFVALFFGFTIILMRIFFAPAPALDTQALIKSVRKLNALALLRGRR